MKRARKLLINLKIWSAGLSSRQPCLFLARNKQSFITCRIGQIRFSFILKIFWEFSVEWISSDPDRPSDSQIEEITNWRGAVGPGRISIQHHRFLPVVNSSIIRNISCSNRRVLHHVFVSFRLVKFIWLIKRVRTILDSIKKRTPIEFPILDSIEKRIPIRFPVLDSIEKRMPVGFPTLKWEELRHTIKSDINNFVLYLSGKTHEHHLPTSTRSTEPMYITNIADIIMTKTMTMTKNKIQNRSIKGQFARKEVPYCHVSVNIIIQKLKGEHYFVSVFFGLRFFCGKERTYFTHILDLVRYYSKASRYTASRYTDLDNARFWIGSKNIWDARFCTYCAFLHVFCMLLHVFW